MRPLASNSAGLRAALLYDARSAYLLIALLLQVRSLRELMVWNSYLDVVLDGQPQQLTQFEIRFWILVITTADVLTTLFAAFTCYRYMSAP